MQMKWNEVKGNDTSTNWGICEKNKEVLSVVLILCVTLYTFYKYHALTLQYQS